MRIEKNQESLFRALLELGDVAEAAQFFADLCTPAELAAMADRWRAVQLLRQGLSYREIYEKSGVSTATVTRVARCLTEGSGGYRLVLDRLSPKSERSRK